MIGGVNFQPGSFDQEQQRQRSQNGSAQGVQEAIKVLSLRLPKVVGAQAVSPRALLSSPGSGGNPRVDSLVQSVLSRMFGQQGGAPSAPMVPPQSNTMPTEPPVRFDGVGGGFQPKREQTADTNMPRSYWESFPSPPPPNVIVGPPPPGGAPRPPEMPYGDPRQGTDADLGGGGTPPGMIAPLPDLRRMFDWLPPPDTGNPLF